MSLDTQNKRASAVHVSLPWRGMLPLTDGSVNGGDRAQLMWLYRGDYFQSGPVIGSWSSAVQISADTGPINLTANTGPIILSK